MKQSRFATHLKRLSLSALIAITALFSVCALCFSAGSAQTDPNSGNLKVFLPLIIGEKPVPVGPVGGTFTSIAFDPGENDNIYAGHFGSGVYKSFDQGNTWYRKNQGLGDLTIQSLATHPTDSNIVFAGTYDAGLYKSYNGGESWQASNGNVLNNHIIYDIEIDPSNPLRMFVVSRIRGNLTGYLSRSMDGGASWTVLFTGASFSTPDYFYDVDIDPISPNVVFLTAHEHGFFKSVNGGASFSAVNSGVTDLSARALAIDNAYTGLVYGGVWHGAGVFRTWNDGTLWQRSSTGLPLSVKILRLYLDPFGRSQKTVFSCTYGNGLYSSADFGASWSSRGLGGQRIYDFVIADGNPQRWYAATENNGIFRSNSYGSNWNTIMADLHLTDITGLTVLPGEPQALAGSVYGQGVFRVTNGGETWQPMNEGLSSLDVVALTVAGDRLYAIGRNSMDVWMDGTWQAVALPEATPEELESGKNWVRARVLLPDEAFWSEVGSSVQPTNLFGVGSELFMRSAGRASWTLNGGRWVQAEMESWEHDGSELARDGTNIVLDLNRLPAGIIASSLEGVTTAVSAGDRCVWAAAKAERVWVTNDCGESWVDFSFEGQVQALAFDPLLKKVLIVGTRESGAFILRVP